MKWIGQHIYDQISRFRDDVYLEDLSTTTETSVLVVDSTGKVSKSTSLADDIIEAEIDTLAGLTGMGATGVNLVMNYDDIQWYNAVNDGNPQLSIGSSATERFVIWPGYASGTQTLETIRFATYTASGTANYGAFSFTVDEVGICTIDDGGIDFAANKGISINGTDILTDSSGTATLSNIDALDATTEATIESAIDTLSNLSTASSLSEVGTITTGTWTSETVIASAYLDADTAHLSGTQTFTGDKTFNTTIAGAINGNAATATTLATTRAINGVNFNGSAAITIPTNRVYGATIKLLPNDFLPNEDGGTSKGVFLDDTAPTGLKPGIAAMELVAVQDIPEGFKATHVDVYASTDLVIQAYEMDLNASGITSRSSAGTANTTLALTAAVNATATNFIAIIVTTTATSNRVWGGTITIESQ